MPKTTTLSQAVTDDDSDRVHALLAKQTIPSNNIVIFAETAGRDYAPALRAAYDKYINDCALAVCEHAAPIKAQIGGDASGWKVLGLFKSDAVKSLGEHKQLALSLVTDNQDNQALIQSSQPNGEVGRLLDTHRDGRLNNAKPTTSRVELTKALNPDASHCSPCRPRY